MGESFNYFNYRCDKLLLCLENRLQHFKTEKLMHYVLEIKFP